MYELNKKRGRKEERKGRMEWVGRKEIKKEKERNRGAQQV